MGGDCRSFLITLYMKIRLSVFFLIIVCLSKSIQLFAQQAGQFSIHGKVNNDKKEALVNCTVSLYKSASTLIIKTTVTDEKGYFEFHDLAKNNYKLEITHIGFIMKTMDSIAITNTITDIDLGTLLLTFADKSLNEVVVESKKPLIEQKNDRLVFNVENSITVTGGNALEVIQKLPGVSIDGNDNLSVRGKQGVNVMIDGKPVYVAGSDLTQFLKSLPASSIDKVELMTNTSAKYDAAGSAALINIRMKKDQKIGANGLLTSGTGASDRGSRFAEGASFNYRSKKVNVYGSYNYNYRLGYVLLKIRRNFIWDDTLNSTYRQTTDQNYPVNTHNVRTGVDWNLSKRTTIGTSLSYNSFHYTPHGGNATNIYDSKQIFQGVSLTDSRSETKAKNYSGNFNFRHSFDSTGKEITFDMDLAKFDNSNAQNLLITNNINQTIDQHTLLNNVVTGIDIKSLKTDLVFPLKKNTKLEAGLKSSWVNTDNDIRQYNIVNNTQVLDTTTSNHFLYKENINAAYLNYTVTIKKYEVEAGLRTEQTVSKGLQLNNNSSFKNNYWQLFPSIFLSKEMNENNSLGISYSRKVDRPTYKQLNPFINIVDQFTHVVGNPYLKPQISSNYEFHYTLKNKYIFSIYYSNLKNVITDVFSQDDSTRINIQYPDNIATSDNEGISVTIPFSIAKWWKANASTDIVYNHYQTSFSGVPFSNSGPTLYLNFSSTLTFKKGFSGELSGNYEGRTAWGQFDILPLGSLNAGLQKVSANKKHVFKLNVNDILHTNKIKVAIKFQTMDVLTSRANDTRFFMFTYSYRFGKSTVPQSKRRSSAIDEETRRAN